MAFSKVVPAGQVLLSIILIGGIYIALLALWIFLLRREMAKGFEPEPVPAPGAEPAFGVAGAHAARKER